MTHVDEGILLAIRDGALVSADDQLHVESCAQCSDALEAARARAQRIENALAGLDVPFDVDAAKERVRAQLDGTSEPVRRAPQAPRHLGRAAAILLVAAGAAYAIPGSPIRAWITGENEATTSGAAATEESQEIVGGVIEVPVTDQGIRVSIDGSRPGDQIEVIWTDASTARVAVPAGSSYSIAEGHVVASVTAGPVQVAFPRSAAVISLEIDGRMVLQRTDGTIDVAAEVLARDADRLILEIPQR